MKPHHEDPLPDEFWEGLNRTRRPDGPREDPPLGAEPPQRALAAHAAPRPKPYKVTLYVRPEQITELEEIQLRERRRTGRRPDKSDLVQEALDLLIAKYRNAG